MSSNRCNAEGLHILSLWKKQVGNSFLTPKSVIILNAITTGEAR